MAKKFKDYMINDIYRGNECTDTKMYKKAWSSSEFCRDKEGNSKTFVEMNFFHKNTRTMYVVRGEVGSYGTIFWDMKSLKRQGKFEKWEEQEMIREKARKERLRWDESGEWV